jgi:hypothetical protein
MPGVSSSTKLPLPTNVTCMMLALAPSAAYTVVPSHRW